MKINKTFEKVTLINSTMTEKEFHDYVKELFDYVPPEHRDKSTVWIYSETDYDQDSICFDLCATVEETKEEEKSRIEEEIRIAKCTYYESLVKLKDHGVKNVGY